MFCGYGGLRGGLFSLCYITAMLANGGAGVVVRLTPMKMLRFFVGIIAVLTLAHIGMLLFTALTGHDNLFGFIRLFNTDEEQSIPNFYSALALLCAALLLAIHAAHAKRNDPKRYRYWVGLSLIFAYISVDEACRIHELLTGVMRQVFGVGASGGILYLSWVVPVGIAILALGLIYLRFFLELPSGLKRLGAVSAAVFVGGALGCELIESKLLSDPDPSTGAYRIVSTVEEFVEMCGVAIWNYALAVNLSRLGVDVQIGFESQDQKHSKFAIAELRPRVP